MEIHSGHLKLSIILQVSAVGGCPLSGVPLYYGVYSSWFQFYACNVIPSFGTLCSSWMGCISDIIIPRSLSRFNMLASDSFLTIPYSLKFLRVKYFAILPNSAQKQIKISWSSFQPRCLASVVNLNFRGRNFSWLFSDPQNLRNSSISKILGYTVVSLSHGILWCSFWGTFCDIKIMKFKVVSIWCGHSNSTCIQQFCRISSQLRLDASTYLMEDLMTLLT